MQSLADRSCLHSWARSHLRLCPAQQRSSTWHICCVMFSPAGVTSRCKWSRRAGSSPSWPRTRLSSVCGQGRFINITDSQVTFHALTKGRSSSALLSPPRRDFVVPLLSPSFLCPSLPGFPLSVCLLTEAFSSKPSVCFRGCVPWWPAFARLHQGHQGRALGRKVFYVGRSGPALICHG